MLSWRRRRPAAGSAPDRLPPPFIHQLPGGRTDLAVVDEQAALRCALSRICASCTAAQRFPLVFVGTQAELDAGVFDRPAMHETCARAAVARYQQAGLPGLNVLLATGSFTIDRPWQRNQHEQPRFRPGVTLWVYEHPD